MGALFQSRHDIKTLLIPRTSLPFRALLALATLLPAMPATPGAAQDATLTLGEAIELAGQHNPEFLSRQNDLDLADWAVRGAYGGLLPGASVGTSFGYQAAGNPRFGIFTGSDLGLGSTTDYYSSGYNLGLSYRLSGAALLAPGHEKSNRSATAAAIAATEFTLVAGVTRQYLAVKRAQDGVRLSEQELARAAENVRLAEARVTVGAAIPLEAMQAEVERGRLEVGVLQAENLVRTELLRLMQQLGVEFTGAVQLTSAFAVRDVPWTLETLTTAALASHPQLAAARATERAAVAGVRMARSGYLPSLSMSAGWSGYARQAGNAEYLIAQARQQAQAGAAACEERNAISAGLSTPLLGYPHDCARFTLSPEAERSIRADNSVFPFGYSSDPFSLSLAVSLPLFDGLARERQVESARVAAADARLQERAEMLRLRTEVGTAYHNLTTARRTVTLEERNQELADQQLVLARERYRLGAATFLELQDAETVKARADRALLGAVYSFHEALADLEAAVGRPLAELGAGG